LVVYLFVIEQQKTSFLQDCKTQLTFSSTDLLFVFAFHQR